jgi:hypothetical protein
MCKVKVQKTLKWGVHVAMTSYQQDDEQNGYMSFEVLERRERNF